MSTEAYVSGCNNGGGGGNFLPGKAVSSKVRRNMETIILGFPCFSPLHLWDFRKAAFFSQKLFCP